MAMGDSQRRPGRSAPGSIGPNGVSSDLELANSARSPVVVWCGRQVKFSSPCTRELSSLPACACTPMALYLIDGRTGLIRSLKSAIVFSDLPWVTPEPPPSS